MNCHAGMYIKDDIYCITGASDNCQKIPSHQDKEEPTVFIHTKTRERGFLSTGKWLSPQGELAFTPERIGFLHRENWLSPQGELAFFTRRIGFPHLANWIYPPGELAFTT